MHKLKHHFKGLLTLIATGLLTANVMAADAPDMSVDDLAKAIEAKTVTILDVNGTDSYKAGHIPGAIDFAAEKDLASKLPEDKSALIVAYCGGPACGAYKQGVTAAKELGYTNVKHLSAGISGWKEAGKEVATVSEEPAEGASPEEAPAEEVSAEQAPSEEASSEEAPAEEAAAATDSNM